MKPIFLYFFFLMLLPAALLAQTVVAVKVDGDINPAIASFIHNGIEKAAKENATCLLIHLNTPGGLSESTRLIVSDLFQSAVPVVVYVSPVGAHAGSAGVFITLAANIAAMAPGTNIGAAHPVALNSSMDSIMNEKVTNDAAAFIRSIAQKRNRNLEWSEEAVRKSVSITDSEALQKKIIDLIAANDENLLTSIDGRSVETASGTKILHTRSAKIQQFDMSMAEKILNIISDPDIAYILMLLGFFGILFEFYNPGAILPGIVGVIALILAFYSIHSLPVNYAGLSLIIFAIVLYLLEIKIISHGLLAIGGTVSLLLGSMMLIRPDASYNFETISLSVIISSTAVTLLFFLFVIGLGIKAQRNRVVTGAEALVGALCTATDDLAPLGTVNMDGEIWNAESLNGLINKGEKARVKYMKDLKLFVEKINT